MIPSAALRSRRAVLPVVAGLLWIVSACGGGSDGGDATSPLAEGEDLVLAESETPVRPPIELGDRDPASVLSGVGLVFGAPDATTLLATEGFASDPLVEQAVAREVYSDTGERLASVVALELAPGVFTSELAVDNYVRGLAGGATEAAEPPTPIELGVVDGFESAEEQRTAVSFRVDDVVVLIDALTAEAARTVAGAIADSAISESAPAPTAATPFAEIDPSSVFTELDGFEFIPFPTDEEKVDLAYEPLPAPALEGFGLPPARLVVIGNEIRGAVWVLPASREVYATGEELVDPMRALTALRSGGEVSEEVVAGRAVYAADGAEATRVFRDENLVLVVDGIDPLNADAITAAWARSLDDP